MSTTTGFRVRVLEPAVGGVAGGTRVVVHGKGFRPLPHSLLVRFRLAETGTRIDVAAKFLLETQLTCVVPSFTDDLRVMLARRTTLPPTSAVLALAPHLVPVQVEVIMDSDRVSNALEFLLHQEISITKITPQFVLMTPPTTVVVTTNLLKLSASSRLYPPKDTKLNTSGPQELAEISSLPVFVRVRQVSERTGAVSERTSEARWRVSPVGVYEVEFDAVMMTFGDAKVELTLNRHEHYRAKDRTPDAVGYCVHRDVTLASIDPCSLSVTSGRSTDVRLLGEGFIDSGDLTVLLLQRNIQEAAANTSAGELLPVARLSATYLNPNELRCSVPANMSFGVTHFQVSLNGGRQFGKDHALALLHRDRAIEGIEPSFASLDGNTSIQIRVGKLTVDTVDAPHQLQNLTPPRRIRVKFTAIRDDSDGSNSTVPLVKVVSADILNTHGECGGSTIVCCRVPSFLDEIKLLKEKHAASKAQDQVSGEFALVRRFRVSLSLGGDSYFGMIPFGYFFPPVIQSMTRHHGPRSGGTVIFLRMKFRVPSQLAIQVRFLQLATRKCEIVPGIVGTEYFEKRQIPAPVNGAGSPSRASQGHQENPAALIVCTSPSWGSSDDVPELTKVQVSFDGGFNFVPVEDEQELITAGLVSPRSKGIPSQLVKDMSHLYFLFYPVPKFSVVNPMSADIQGGSFIKIGGDRIADHGGRISVVFQSPELSRKVIGFIEHGELRCCVPPFNVGSVSVYVSLNGEQYTKCEFIDPDSKRPIDFVFYSSPLLQRLSPLSTSISHSSLIRIFGVNLIETGRVKVRFGFSTQSGKLVYKDVPGRAEHGVIMAQSPLFGAEYGNLKAVVDIALNGNDFSGKVLSLYYYASYSIKRVEPPAGAVDIPIPVTLFFSQNLITDELLVRVRFKLISLADERIHGPVIVTRWDTNRLEFLLPALCEFTRLVHDLESAIVDISFDKTFFHPTGDLLKYYRPYKLPPVITISPLVGHFEQYTTVVARCSELHEGDSVTMTMTLELLNKQGSSVAVVAETNTRRHTLTWQCPPLSTLVKLDLKKLVAGDTRRMLVPARLAIQISTIDRQLLTLPFKFQYYRMPVLLSMNPRVGYICGGALISFEFNEPIETPTIDFRFGSEIVTSGRVREDNTRLVECLSPVLDAGIYTLSMSFDEQYFEDVYLIAHEADGEVDGDENEEVQDDMLSLAGIPEERKVSSGAEGGPKRIQCLFQAFAMPHFTIPTNTHRVYGFGPVAGGSYVVIKGRGFIPDGKIYVRFSSPHGETLVGPSGAQSEVTVKATVVDDNTVLCTSPASTRPGRVLLQVTYNLQQYTTSSCFFEYHDPTKFTGRGILCGPVSGGAPVCIQVEEPVGLPEDKTLLRSSCAIRFVSERTRRALVVDTPFDEETLQLRCTSPSWPSNELVAIEVALSRDAEEVALLRRQFFPTNIRFLFYDPPEGLITVEPSAGPMTGGTEVFALCGKMVDTGEIMVSVTIAENEEVEQVKKLTSVGEDEEDGEDEEEADDSTTVTALPLTDNSKEVYLIKGKIVGEAVSFIAPAVSKPGVAYLNIALNGINYTSTQTSILRFKYYCDPIIRRVSPTWSSMDTACVITIQGDFIEDHGCKAVIQFQQQQGRDAQAEHILVDAWFVDSPIDAKSTASPTPTSGAVALQCCFQPPQAGFYELQISLNGGQQFTACKYMAAVFGNYSGSACTALLPFRSFASPFLLATPTGSVAGGSSVILFMNKRLSKLLARETKCHVQFTPVKNGDTTVGGGNGSLSITGSPQRSSPADGIVVVGEIDHQEAKITCRAPLLRTACVAALDLLLPAALTFGSDGAAVPAATKTLTAAGLTSCSAFFGARERERFQAYESPSITEIAPSCGPLSGGTCMVIECSNIVDTGQIFVRFRSTSNERECVLVPAVFSRTFPDGSISASPLLICHTPQVEVIDRIVVSVTEAVSSSTPSSPGRGATRDGPSGNSVMTSKARAQIFQRMAEACLRNGHSKNILRVARAVLTSAPTSSISAAVTIMVDFTMNAGEQFIAHSVSFQFYPAIDPREVKWFPRHLPTQCLDRSSPIDTRIVTIQLPKTLRSFTDSTSAAERVAFYFEGAPQQNFSSSHKRRGSSFVLHDTGSGRELVVLDAAPASKLRKESTMRRRSTFLRNTSISATSNNLLDSSSASLAANVARPRAALARGAGSRRPSGAGSGPGFVAAGSTSNVTSPSSSQNASPYIAAKIVKGGLEVTCPVPEFSGCGVIQVYFSFNAQQFVCLGDLHVHEPLLLRENRQHLFTSNIGGDRFTLFCSPSSIFDFLSPSDVLNDAEVLARQQQDIGIVKRSHVLQHEESFMGEAADDPRLLALAHRSNSTSASENDWRDRQFHVVQIHLVPPNPRLLRKLVVSARSLGTRVEFAASSPDDYGCCVFETNDWVTDMVLATTLPDGSGLSSFSQVFSMAHSGREKASANSSASLTYGRTHALIVQLPVVQEEFVACCFNASKPNQNLLLVDAEGALVEGSVSCSGTEQQYSKLSFDVSSSEDPSTGYFVCLDMRECDSERSEVHAVVADAVGVQVYLTGCVSRDVGVWVIACVSPQPSGRLATVEIDCRVDSLEHIAHSELITQRRTRAVTAAATSATSRNRTLRPLVTKPTTVTTCVHFACADSSRNLSASGAAQLILPGDHTLSSFKASIAEGPIKCDVGLHCEIPALPFNGPTILSVLVDGVTFSNSLCIHCYDPRLWRITRLDPPCGLVHQAFKMRLIGEHFVDNKKTIVRFSDSIRYQNYSATMERYRLLIVRVAAVRNLRSLLPPQYVAAITAPAGGATGGLSPQKATQSQSQQLRDDPQTSFTIVARVEYRDQVFQTTSRESAVLASLSPSANVPPLGWEDQFEVQVPAHAMATALILVTVELVETSGNRSAWELGRMVVPAGGIQEATLTKRTYPLEEHFRWRNRSEASTALASDADVFLHLSPLMARQDVFVCDVSPFAVSQCLRVQISSGDSFFSPCPAAEDQDDQGPSTFATKVYRPLFQMYELPVVTDTTPRVLPRTAGGEIVITGERFMNCGNGHQIWVRLFVCSSGTTLADPSEQARIEQINANTSLQTPSKPTPFFIRDVRATFVSSTMLKATIPPRLASYNIYYRVSIDDGAHFSQASRQSRVMMYSADSIDPKGGPVSGNTYVAVHGSNLHACMGLGGVAPVVKLTWMRGAKELESIVVRGEFYPPEEVVYFYTPQSKFGLQNITVQVEISLVQLSDLLVSALANTSSEPSNMKTINLLSIVTTAVFGRDEIPFVVYRTPTIKAISPLQSLVCGLTPIELIVQGLDEKAAALLKNSIKARFKRRGQMQIADVHHSCGAAGGGSDGKLVTVVPRFVVGSATATEVTSMVNPSSPTRQSQPRPQATPVKVWTRHGAVFVVLLRARNLLVTKKTSTCNPFVVIHCNKSQLKSTRKDGTSSPVWNEIFDFDWRSETELPQTIRLSVENQLSSNQSEMLGQIAITFAEPRDLSKSFCTRAWFPLRRVSARGASNIDSHGKSSQLGDVEAVIAYLSMPPKRSPARFLQAAALKTSIMSAMQQQKKLAAAAAAASPINSLERQETPRARKERLLRAFKRHGAPSSLVPSEIIVELAVNGQDFWSSAPSRCLAVATPLVMATEPSFICLSGGSPLSISGLNFMQSGILRVAFAVVPASNDAGRQGSPSALLSKQIVMVDARYRSSHCITCVTPPLHSLGATESSVVNVYVTTNGIDFDSVALPLSSSELIAEETTDGEARPPNDVNVIQSDGEKYVIHNKLLVERRNHSSSQPLLHQVRVYRRPIIHRVRPADGVYTSLLVVEGCDFSNTGIAIARYCSTHDAQDTRTSSVSVVSSERMECAMPDFPRGTVVTMSIAMNGLEFVSCPGELAVFQSPRLTEIVPNWISTATDMRQDVSIRGVNLTTKSSASGSVQVSFQRGDVKKIIKGQCVDGEVLCSVPSEAMQPPTTGTRDPNGQVDALTPIFVDVWLGGTHKMFTGKPLELYLYSNIPAVTAVSPTNGPIYGGYAVTVEGSGFINTGKILVRFLLLQDAVVQPSFNSADANHSPTAPGKGLARRFMYAPAMFADVAARFESAESLVCTAPSFPQEGVYSVDVALNGVAFNTDAAIRRSSAWFLAWQNWQRRKQLTAQRESLEAALSVKMDAPPDATPVNAGEPMPTIPGSLVSLRPPSSPRQSTVETAFGRRATSRSALRSPHGGGDTLELVLPERELDSPRRRREQLRAALDKMVDDESRDRVEDHFADVRLLQWHPASVDDRNRSLAGLLSDLLIAPDTQQIMIRRLGFVFRVRGARDASTGQRIFNSLLSFTQALKLIFPHAPEKEFEELWVIIDPAQLGLVSLSSLTKRFLLADTLRPRSPEPGPTHYHPNYALVETKPPATVILPESTPTTEEAGLPSEFFMNYDAFKAVRPRVHGGAFLKRKLLASWCNPVPKDKIFQTETDEELERTFMEMQESQQTKTNSSHRLCSLASSPRHSVPRPPADGAASSTGGRQRRKQHLAQPAVTLGQDRSEDEAASAANGVSRGERLALAATAHETSTANKLTSPRGASPAAASSGRFPSSRTRSILHDDIAPLYLKFLRSKEVQKGHAAIDD